MRDEGGGNFLYEIGIGVRILTSYSVTSDVNKWYMQTVKAKYKTILRFVDVNIWFVNHTHGKTDQLDSLRNLPDSR